MQHESEKSHKSTFPQLVTISQQKWREQQRLLSLKQSHELPQAFSEWMYGLVLDNLPSYIPQDVRQRVRETHPTPLITVGAVPDARMEGNSHEGSIQRTFPQHTSRDNILPLIYGMEVLDEIVANTITHDVITNLIDDMQQSSFPGKKLGTHMLSLALDAHKKKNGSAAGEMAVDILANATLGDAEAFKRELVRAALSGDATEVNNTLTKAHEMAKGKSIDISTLDALAIFIGENPVLRYGPDKTRRERMSSEYFTKYLQIVGCGSIRYPGVVQIVTLNQLIDTLILSVEAGAFAGFMQSHNWAFLLSALVNVLPSKEAVDSLAGTVYTAIHEIAHYLCMDTTRRGLPLESHIDL